MPSPDVVARFRAARTDPSLAVLEGFHAIKHALRFGARFELMAASDRASVRALAERLAPDVAAGIDEHVDELPSGLFAELSPTPPDTGIIAIAQRPTHRLADLVSQRSAAPMVLLESPSHGGNIGAVIRVAAGAGAAAVITTGPNDPWNPAALRGSAGLHFALPVIRTGELAPGNRLLVAIDPEGDALAPGTIPDSAILAFGSERSGLTADLLARCTRRVRIPMEPGVSSLNLATAVAITLYSWRLHR